MVGGNPLKGISLSHYLMWLFLEELKKVVGKKRGEPFDVCVIRGMENLNVNANHFVCFFFHFFHEV